MAAEAHLGFANPQVVKDNTCARGDAVLPLVFVDPQEEVARCVFGDLLEGWSVDQKQEGGNGDLRKHTWKTPSRAWKALV